MRLPVNDGCHMPARPVYRLYNNPQFLIQVNHRFTAGGATYNALRAAGWIGEGLAFCAKWRMLRPEAVAACEIDPPVGL